MSDSPLPDGAVDQFASTFKEWHYLAAGFSAGFATGMYLTGRWLLEDRDASE
jgi:hypothetical protein